MILHLMVRRFFFLIFVLISLSLITFSLSHIVPNDPARIIAGPRASEATVAQIRKEYGLDRPLAEQYVQYISGVVQFDFGKSLSSRRPVSEDLKRYLPATAELTFYAIIFAVALGIPLGVLSAVQKNSSVDAGGRILSIAGLSIPSFWLAIMLQFLLFSKLGLLPDGQRLPIGVQPPPTITSFYTIDALLTGKFGVFVTAFKHLAMPALVLGFNSLAIITRMVRSGMLEVLGQDYIRSARAKGVREDRVIIGHALKNALLPATTVIGLQIGLLLAGAVLVEIIFSWPGIGRYAFQAIQNYDYNAVISVTLVVGFAYVIMNMVVDIAYAWLDPRIKFA